MPRYDFQCQQCDFTQELTMHMDRRNDKVQCPSCRYGTMQRIWTVSYNGRYAFEPITTTDITGEPLELTGPRQRDSLLEQYGKTLDSYSKDDLERRKSEHRSNTVASRTSFSDVVKQIKEDRGEWSPTGRK